MEVFSSTRHDAVRTDQVQLYLSNSAYEDIKKCTQKLNEVGYTVYDLGVQLFVSTDNVITSRRTSRKLKDNDIIIWLIENGLAYANNFLKEIGANLEIRDIGYDIKSHIEEFGHKPKQKNLKVSEKSKRDLLLAHADLKTRKAVDEDGNAIKLNGMMINLIRLGRKDFCKIFKVKIRPLVFK